MNSTGASNHRDTGHDDATYNTALRGAFLAFQKTARPTGSNPSTPVRDVRDASNTGPDRSPSLSRHTTGNGSAVARDQSLAGHRTLQQPAAGQSILLTPTKSSTGDQRSPSLIAATLAASRSTSPVLKTAPSARTSSPQAPREHGKATGGEDSTVSSVTNFDLGPDSSSIAPTNALISLFERKGDEMDPVKRSPTVSSAKKRPSNGLRPVTPSRVTSPVVTSPSTGRDVARVKSPLRQARDTELRVSASLSAPERKQLPATPPLKAGRANTVVLSPQPRQVSSSKFIGNLSNTNARSAAPPVAKSTKQRPTDAPGTTEHSVASSTGPGILVRRSSSSLSNDTFVSASSAPSPGPDSPRRSSPHPPLPKAPQSLRPQSANPVPIPPPPRHSASRSSTNLPLDSLTNAIVAGSLASSRASPTKKPPTPPPRKQTPHMRQTLRAPRTKSEEEVNGYASHHHKKKSLGKLSSRKKHAHHEGARHRWREVITARERHRYEGVWASNRGLLLDKPSVAANGLQGVDTSQLVANVVVRDIWARSRLPFDELAEVWDLVDTEGRGALDKAQFVVGMWLIDQRLRGRKIPRKVSDSVWGSVKGVRVLGPDGKKR